MSEREAFCNKEISFRETGQPHTVPLRAPYMFVPAGDNVLITLEEPRHDRPLPGAVSGRLTVTLTAETPILVGGEGTANDVNNSPAKAPDGRWMIPGTSLRGMIRATLESAAFARMAFVDDCAVSRKVYRKKVPCRYTLHKIIARAPRPPADKPNAYDLVQALFGWAAPEVDPDTPNAKRPTQERALRSRVRFGFCLSESTEDGTELINKTWAATRPRASFWPYYLRPADGARHPVDYDNDKARVAGRKRYPARGEAEANLPHVDEGEESADRRNSILNFLPAGTTFTGEIRLHNVTRIELGALIWVLTFGQIKADGSFDDKGYRQMLGRARTWGYGQMRLEITENRLAPVLEEGAVDLVGAMDAFRGWVCEQLDAASFEEIEAIARLLAAAHAETGKALKARLRFPAVDGNDGVAENIVKGYTEIRKAAQKKGKEGRSAPRDAGSPDFVGLPPYPRLDEEGGNA